MSPPRPVPWLLLLCVGAALLRIAWISLKWMQSGPALEFDDEVLHWDLAHRLVSDGAMVTGDGRYAARMPLYPLYLALFAGLGQSGILLARLGQALLGAALVGVVFTWTRASLGTRSAVVAGLLVALDPYSIFFSNLLLTEGIFTSIAVALTACAWSAAASRGASRSDGWVVFGLASLGAAAILTRPSSAGWIPLLWLLLLVLDPHRLRALGRIVMCAAALAILMLPWGLRNARVIGDFAWLSTNGGVTLYDAVGPQAKGNSDQSFLKTMPGLAGLGEVSLDAHLRAEAIAEMRADPGRIFRLAGVKFLRTWNPIPNVESYRQLWVAAASAIFTCGVLLLVPFGAWRIMRTAYAGMGSAPLQPEAARSRRSMLLLLLLPIGYFTLLHMIYIGSLRYRVPVMPFAEILAAGVFASPSVLAAAKTAPAAQRR